MTCVLSWVNPDNSIEVLELDVYTNETHDYPCEITDSPVEQGPDVTDNVRRLPPTLTLEGYVSECPTPDADKRRIADGADALGGVQVFGGKPLDVPSAPDFQQRVVNLDVPDSPLRANAAALVTAGFNALMSAVGLKSGPMAQVMQRASNKPVQATAQVWAYSGWSSHVQHVFKALEDARGNAVTMTVITDYKTYSNMVIQDLSIPRTIEDGDGATFKVVLRQITLVSSQNVEAPKPSETLSKPRKSNGSKTTGEGEESKEKKKTLLRAAVKAALG